MTAFARFLTGLFSGADNVTPAIGRVMGAMIVMWMVCALPAVIVAALWGRNVAPSDWFALLASLAIYVPSMSLAAGGLIWGTAPTEPKANP